jgi:hypothetical protein
MTAMELKLDYFKVYDVQNLPTESAITLKGQFDRATLKMQLALLDFFANPAAKNQEPMYDKNAHLSWYRGIQPGEPMRRVVAENQFGKCEFIIGSGYGLLVPTEKVEKGSALSQTLDHYKVYRVVDVVGQLPSARLTLKDQFGPGEVVLGPPRFFAVPVTKRHGDKQYPINNKQAHLLIYSITPKAIRKSIKLRNQFTNGLAVRVLGSLMLAVPSLKRDWKPN